MSRLPFNLLLLWGAAGCSVDHTGLLAPDPLDASRTDADDAFVARDVVGGDAPSTDGGPDALSDVPTDVPFDAGDDSCRAYVSLVGNDSRAGTAAEPFRTLARALETSSEVICIAMGNYSENIEITRSVTIRGSYCTFDGERTCPSTIAASTPLGTLINGGAARISVRVDGVNFSSNTGGSLGSSSYAIRSVNADVYLTSLELRPGNGAVGQTGSPASGPGARGDDPSTFNAGANCSGGGRAGLGGSAFLRTDGTDGDRGDGPLGGNGGAGGLTQNSPTAGINGSRGGDAIGMGEPGLGGPGLGRIGAGALYIPASGEVGGQGPHGGGGGGGGGGGADIDRGTSVGGARGHGGGGGCGGPGGGGGGGGGGSFGVSALQSAITFGPAVTVFRGNGGPGGVGVVGREGGQGGTGRSSDGAFNNGRGGGKGGDGGRGGQGGLGGGGGGGPSLGVAMSEDSSVDGPVNVMGGMGGMGGGGGGPGASGLVAPGATLLAE